MRVHDEVEIVGMPGENQCNYPTWLEATDGGHDMEPGDGFRYFDGDDFDSIPFL